jgi:type IV secretory pathway VirB10-like protein
MTDDSAERADREETKPVETQPEEQPRPAGGIAGQIWRRIQEERNRPKPVEVAPRGRNNMDRSKAFLVLATTVVLAGFAFLALFSTSGAEKRAQERRTKPNLGRPEAAGRRGGRSTSTVPLLSADQSDGDATGDQLSPDDILATSRKGNQYALSNAPTVNDPALNAYRRQNEVTYTSAPAAPTLVPATPPPADDSEALKKSSLVFVRNTTATAGQTGAAQQPAFIERKGASTLLPTGSRLVARLQMAVSSAVKVPAIAVIEYNYERDGEIVIPAGTKAIGQMAQANQNGQVGLRFTTLETPDGSTEAIEGSGVGLDFGPLKGTVNGRNRAKRALVRSLTGVGTVASYVVGGGGFGGLSSPLNQSLLLREQLATNVGQAGEQELAELAYSQNVVVTLPGNTRFYIVLQEVATAPNRDSAPSSIPSPAAAELRELMALKSELNRMYGEGPATQASEAQSPQR